MFGFFSDVKTRLLALEQKIEVIWQHLFNKVEDVPQEVVNEVHSVEAEVVKPDPAESNNLAS